MFASGTLLRAALIAAALAAAPGMPAAEPIPPARVAVLDVHAVVDRAKAARKLRARLRAERAALRQAFESRRARLRNEIDALLERRTDMSARAFRTRQRALETRLTRLLRGTRERRRRLDAAASAAFEQLRRRIVAATSALAARRGVNLVLDRQHAPLLRTRLDLTDEVLARLNRTTPRLEFSLDQGDVTPSGRPDASRGARGRS